MEPSHESIQHLLFREEPEEIKYPMYRSKFSQMVREEVKRRKMCHRTMGFPSDFPRTPPEDYLKKRTRMVRRPVVDVKKPTAVASTKIPTREDWYVPKEHPPINFILKNIRDAVHSVPKKGPYRDYDTAFCRRVKHRVYCTPCYSKQKEFGKIPIYIIKRNEENERLRKLMEEERARLVEQPVCRLVPPEERQQLLDELKNAWAEMQKEFQLLPMLNDTPPKIKRKEKLERDLMEIENDIKMVDTYQRIYVCDTERMKGKWASLKPCEDEEALIK